MEEYQYGSSGPCRCQERLHWPRAFFIMQAVFGKWEGWITRTPFWTQIHLIGQESITIFSKQAGFRLGGKVLHPSGYAGACKFQRNGRTLQVLDYAVLLISSGRQACPDLWRLLKRYRIPVFLFINKMDKEGTDKSAASGTAEAG